MTGYAPPLLDSVQRLRLALKLQERNIEESLFWLEHYRATGRPAEPHRLAAYREALFWENRWRLELADLGVAP